MEDSDYWNKVAEAMNVECPTCGSHPSFEITGRHKFNLVSCGHPALEDLVFEHLDAILVDDTPSLRYPFRRGGTTTPNVIISKK